MDSSEIEKERERIKNQYASYDAKNMSNTSWAAFNEREAAYRSQQYLALASFMRQLGRYDFSGCKILDVGCGKGRLLRSFLDMGAKPEDLFGVDLNQDYIREGKLISPNLNLKFNDGIHLEFSSDSFDLVTQFVVFSSIVLCEMHHKLADEMWRVLKPGGYIFWWDLPSVIFPVNGHIQLLDLGLLFPNAKIHQTSMGICPKPSAVLRKFPGHKVLGYFLDAFAATKPTHSAALIGPKK